MDILKVYIAGKITGENPDIAEQSFLAKEKELSERGYATFNPYSYGNSQGTESTTWHEYMKMLIPKLCECDAICLLHNWEQSAGAREEARIAQMLNLKFIK